MGRASYVAAIGDCGSTKICQEGPLACDEGTLVYRTMQRYAWMHRLFISDAELAGYRLSIKPHTNYQPYLFHLILLHHKDSLDISIHSTISSHPQELPPTSNHISLDL